MIIKECVLDVMENLLFVSTEFGAEYHAYGFIGNTALPYALGLVEVNYKQFAVPMHREHFGKLAVQGIYVTPATFVGDVAFKLERFNCMPDRYDLTWDPAQTQGGRTVNYPDEGWWKMIRRGNKGVFYILSEKDDVIIPAYARIGKLMSKCKITTAIVPFTKQKGRVEAGIILRAEDIPSAIELIEYEKMPVQHGMYLRNCTFEGPHVSIRSTLLRTVNIPAGCGFYTATGEEAG
nr:type I-D CRISPR-associated protein Cas5/Csc1 [Candidatus Sigynarchaeota archaeon]